MNTNRGGNIKVIVLCYNNYHFMKFALYMRKLLNYIINFYSLHLCLDLSVKSQNHYLLLLFFAQLPNQSLFFVIHSKYPYLLTVKHLIVFILIYMNTTMSHLCTRKVYISVSLKQKNINCYFFFFFKYKIYSNWTRCCIVSELNKETQTLNIFKYKFLNLK